MSFQALGQVVMRPEEISPLVFHYWCFWLSTFHSWPFMSDFSLLTFHSWPFMSDFSLLTLDFSLLTFCVFDSFDFWLLNLDFDFSLLHLAIYSFDLKIWCFLPKIPAFLWSGRLPTNFCWVLYLLICRSPRNVLSSFLMILKSRLWLMKKRL